MFPRRFQRETWTSKRRTATTTSVISQRDECTVWPPSSLTLNRCVHPVARVYHLDHLFKIQKKKRTSKWNVKVNALFLRTRTQSCAKLTLRGARLNVIDLLSILPINGLHGSKWGTSSRGFFSSVSAAAAAHFIPISQTHWWSFLSGRCVRQSLKRLSAENCSPPLPPPLEPDRTIVAF